MVCEQNVTRRGEQHESLVHAGGDVIKLGLTAAQLVHLHADAAVLAVDAVQQGGKLVICRVFQWVMQIERGNRREKDMGQAAREQGRNEQRQQHHEHDPRRRARKRPESAVRGGGNTQKIAVFEPQRVVIGLLRKGLGKTAVLTDAGFGGLLNFGAAEVVFHAGGAVLVVIEHGAIA